MTKHHVDDRAARPTSDVLDRDCSAAPDAAGRPAAHWADGLPDLSGIDLDALRTLDNPALKSVLDVLVRRTVEPAGVLSAFGNAL